MKNNITTDQLLDCLTQGWQSITPDGMRDLRSTLEDLGYGGAGQSLPTCNIDDVMPIAEGLVAKGDAVWRRGNWLQITVQGLKAAGENPTLVVNWSTLDQELVNEDEDGQEAFVRLAREYAEEHDLKFDTMRNIHRAGFFLSLDGQTKCDDLDDEVLIHFERICERLAQELN